MSVLPATHPNQRALAITGRDYLSWSQISTFRQCPLKFYYRYVLGLPEEEVSSSLAFGGAIHAALEYHFNRLMAGLPAPDLDALAEAFWVAWRDRSEAASIRFSSGEDLRSVATLARHVLHAFQASRLAQASGRILAVEEPVRESIIPDAPDLLARLDLLIETDDALAVIDFKTSRSRWSNAQVELAAEQLLLYSELAWPLAGGRPLQLANLVLTKTRTPEAQLLPVAVNRQRVEQVKRTVATVWNAIEAGHYYPAPSPLNCAGCPFVEPCRHGSC